MRRLELAEHVSLDGVIQVPGDGSDFACGDRTALQRTPAGRDAT